MEIKIGIADSNRELVVQSKESSDDVKKTVTEVLAGRTAVLELTDDKGKQYLVPAARVSYVEIGNSDNRSVGFAAT